VARYRILSWRGIPAQLKVFGETGRPRSVQLPDWFGQEIDRVAMRDGIVGTDAYLELWEWSDDAELPGTADEVAATLVAELEARWRPDRDAEEGAS
jgi:Virulence factor